MSNELGGDLSIYVKNITEPMTYANYNEIDGLVFSSIVYNSFESSDITWTATQLENGISLSQFAQALIEADERNPNIIGTEDKKALLKAIANSKRYDKCIVTNLAACNGTTMWDSGQVSTLAEDAQWAAMTININDGSNTAVVAMRGTDGTTLGWNEDFEIGFEEYGTTAQRLSRDYLTACTADDIYGVGHSKGGNNIVVGYMMCEKEVRDRISWLGNYDGPGNNHSLIDNFREGYEELKDKLNNYFPKDSIIGQLLCDNPGNYYFCEADYRGHIEDKWILGEHDTYAWVFFEAGSLDNSQQSFVSRALNRVLDMTLRELSNAESREAMQALIWLGIPALIAGEDGEHISINFTSWQNALLSIMQGCTSLEAMWTALLLMRRFVSELALEGVTLLFTVPEEAEFLHSLRGLCVDFFRNFKNEAEKLWEGFLESIKAFNPPKTENKMEATAPVVYSFKDKRLGRTDFFINVDSMRLNIELVRNIAEAILKQSEDIQSIGAECTGIAHGSIGKAIYSVGEENEKFANDVKKIGQMMDKIIQLYQDTERTIQASG